MKSVLIELKYNDTITSIDIISLNNYHDIIHDIKHKLHLKLSKDEMIMLYYIDKDNDQDKIEISSIEDLTQITLFHQKNYKGNLPLELLIIPTNIPIISFMTHIPNEPHLKENFDYDSINNSNSDIMLVSSKATNININHTKTLEIESNNLNIIQQSLTMNEKNRNILAESFDNLSQLYNHHVLNQPLIIPHCKTMNNHSNHKIDFNAYSPEVDSLNDIIIKHDHINNKEDELVKKNLCSNCSLLIKETKYLCVLCSKYQLCMNCYKEHSIFHPLLLVQASQRNICSIEEMIDYVHNKKPKPSKGGLFSGLYSAFASPSKSYYKLKIYPFGKKNMTTFALAQGEKKTVHIVIENLSTYPIEEDLTFQIKNVRRLTIAIDPVQGLKKEGIQITDLVLTAGYYEDEFQLKIKLKAKEGKVNCNTLTLNIKVVNKEKVFEENVNMFFKDYHNVKVMSKNDKGKLYNILLNDSINKTIKEIDDMVLRNSYDINKILEELSSVIEENAEENID